jgi:hypothetical protein
MTSPFSASRRDRRLHRLLTEARAGDPAALRRLAEETGAELWRVAALLTDESYASELVALTMQVTLAPHTPLPAVGEVRHQLLRHLYQLAGAWQGTGSGLLSMLPLEHRAFHALTQLGGLDHDEVAAVCGVEVATVRAGCTAARAVLSGRNGAPPQLDPL